MTNPTHLNRNQSGFTLIELLVVIAILSILATIILAAINPRHQIDLANDAHRKADLAQVRDALNNYAATHHQYPSTGSVWQCYGCSYDTGFTSSNWIPGLINEG